MSDKTKYALVASLEQLLAQKPLNQITIQEIADNCNVNRMTFYYHFHDVYELIDWSFETMTQQVMDSRAPGETLQETVLRILRYIQENRGFILNIFNSVSNERVNVFLVKMLTDPILNYIAGKADDMNVSSADRQFVASFYRSALIGMIWQWVRSNLEEDPAEIVRRLRILLRGNADLVLRNFEEADLQRSRGEQL